MKGIMMKIKHVFITTLTATLLCISFAACKPENPSDAGGHKPSPKPPAGAQPPQHTGGQQPAPVQGDPSVHNTQPGEVDLYVEWRSENSKTPVCEWSKNGVSQPCANMAKGAKEPGVLDYIGLWEYSDTGKAGDVYTVTAQGTGAFKSVDCSIGWKGVYHTGVTNGKRCGIQLTLN